MLTSLLPFQAQGWEKWLSRITFTRDKQFTIQPNKYKLLPSHNTFKPNVSLWKYANLAFAVPSPGPENTKRIIRKK